MITIVDYGVGNVEAVANMLKRINVICEITKEYKNIQKASKIILPGNGSFDACMRGLRDTGLIPLLEERVIHGSTSLLGICVGAQMLGHSSEEGSEPGLGWIDMYVKRFPELTNLRVPHMGWREVELIKLEHSIVQGLDNESKFYFVHSYFMDPVNQNDILLKSKYGIEFAAAVTVKNVVGVQFHPEKSHRYGKQLLLNFALK